MAWSILTRSIEAGAISVLLKEESLLKESSRVFLRQRYQAEMHDCMWDIWHPVAAISSYDRDNPWVVVSFDDGTVDANLNVFREVEVAIVRDLQDVDVVEGWGHMVVP